MIDKVAIHSDADSRIQDWDPEENLSSAAVDAALELDRLSSGGTIDRRPVDDLVRRLGQPFLSQAGVPVPPAYVDSSFVLVLDDAIRESAFTKHIETVEELRALANTIGADLAKIAAAEEGASFPTVVVAQLRDFCLSLARRARTLEARDRGDDE